MTMVFMKVAVADEPAHSESRKPRLTTSRRPDPRMSARVGRTRESTTSGVSTFAEASSSRSSIWVTEPAPMTLPRSPRARRRRALCRGDGAGADDVAEVAQRAEQPDQQWGDRQDLPERGFRREP